MNILGLILEILLLAFAVYVYLFAIGVVMKKDSPNGAKAEELRKSSGRILRILSLLLAAMMLVNIYLHLVQWE